MKSVEELLRFIEKENGHVAAVTEQSIANAEAELGHAIPSAYRRFLVEVGEVETRHLCFAKVSLPAHEWYWPRMHATARRYGLLDDLEPFCEQNNDFICFTAAQEIVWWSHHHFVVKRWFSFNSWLDWLAQHA